MITSQALFCSSSPLVISQTIAAKSHFGLIWLMEPIGENAIQKVVRKW